MSPISAARYLHEARRASRTSLYRMKSGILIISSDQDHYALEQRDHSAVIVTPNRVADEAARVRQYNVVIVDLSLNRQGDWDVPNQISRLATRKRSKP